MAVQYTTPVGICGEGDHVIEDAPAIENKGYMSPEEFQWTGYASGMGQTQSERVEPHKRLCRTHYLEAFARRYPGEELPAI